MKKIMSLIVLMLLVVSMVSGMILEEPGISYRDGTENSQFYTVVFDEEGEAAVASRLSFVNLDKDPMDSIEIFMAGDRVRILNIFQEVYDTEEKCSYYEEVCTLFEDGSCKQYTKECSDYYTSQVYPPKYFLTKTELVDVPEGEQTSYIISLPKSIKQGELLTLLLYYKVTGFVEENSLTSEFRFQTLQTDFDINLVRVGVNVIGDNKILGVESNVNYQSNFASLGSSYSSKEAFASDELYSVSRNLGSGMYTKTASYLDPMESFTVSGKYSDKWIVFNWGKLVVGLIILLILIGSGYGGYRVFSNIKSANRKSKKRKHNGLSLGQLTMLGSGSALLMTLIVWIATWVGNSLLYSFNYKIRTSISLIIGLIEILLILFLLFGPSVYVGVKQGAEKGLVVFGITLAALILFGILSVIIFIIISMMAYPIYSIY